jgi:hypothetical protein
VHIITRPRPGLVADCAFEQAAIIFADICPGNDFLKLSQEMDKAVKATLGENAFDEEDEDQMVLDSAVGMIEKPKENELKEAIAGDAVD